MFRAEKDRWERPYSLLDIHGEDVAVSTPKVASRFCSTVVKPYVSELTQNINMNTLVSAHIKKDEGHPTEEIWFFFTGMMETRPSRSQFDEAGMAEFKGFMERGVFTVEAATDAVGYSIYGSVFVNTPQNVEKT